MATQEEMIQDIYDRLQAQGEPMTDESVRGLIASAIEDLKGDEGFVRKMRFGTADPQLVGTKYARYGLSVADIELLYDLQNSLVGQRRVDGNGVYTGPSENLTKTFEAVSEARYLSQDQIRAIDGKALDDLYPRIDKRNLKAYEDAYRAMDTAESGYGNQLVGAQYVGSLWEAARNQSQLFSLVNSFEMTAPTTYMPVEVDFPEVMFVSESTANNSSNYSTVKTGSQRVTVTAKKFLTHQMWSGEMEEDSLIPFVPFLRGQLAKSLAFYPDSTLLNGDDTNAATGNINSDDADPADTKHYLAFDGIRHGWIVDATGQGVNQAAAITFAALRKMKTRAYDTTYFHNWGNPNSPDDFIYATDIFTASAISALDEVIAAKVGTGQALLNGESARILGHPVLGLDCYTMQDTDGKYTTTSPTTNSVYGSVTAFNRNGIVAGWRRRVKLETERLPATDQTRLVMSYRYGQGRFTPTGAASGIRWVSGLYNISL